MQGAEPRRVLYYVEALDIGGANQTTVTAAVEMRRRGHAVFFASMDGPLRDRLLSEGIPWFPLDTRARHPSPRLARRLGEMIDREKIDLVCPNGLDCVMDVLLATIPRGVPVVPTFSGIYPDLRHPRLPKAIVVSGEYRDVLVRRFGWDPGAIELLMNRIDTRRFRPGLDGRAFQRRWGLAEDTPVVLMACRLDPLKIGGVRFLLDAARDLGLLVPAVRIVLAGDGEMAAEVRARIAGINAKEGCDRVILAGKVLEMEQAFSAADVVVGNGARSGLEGYACGKPVVSVGESGLAGIFGPDTIEDFAYHNFDKGRVFDGTTRRDPLALAHAVAGLLEEPERRGSLGEFGRQYIVQHLGVEAGASRLEEILTSAKPRGPVQRLRDSWEFSRTVLSFARAALARRFRRMFLGSEPLPVGAQAATSGRRFLRDSGATFLTGVFSLTVATVQAAVVARVLRPEGKGALTTALLVPQLLITFAPLGINWAATYHLGRGSHDRRALVRTVLTALLLLAGAGMVLCLAAGLLVRDSFLRGVPVSAFLLAVLTIPTQISLVCLGGLFRGEMRILDVNRMDATRSALMFLFIVLALLALGLGVTGVVLAQLTAECLVIAWAFRHFGGIPLKPLLDRSILKSLMGYGLQVYSFTILLYLNYRLDLFLVRTMLDLRQTGLYATAVSLAEILWMVPTSIGWVLFPSVARSGGIERDRLTLTVCRNAFWLMLVLCGVLAIGRNLVIRAWFGGSFLPAAPALLAILPGILAMAVQLVLGSDLSGRGHPLPVTLGAALGLTVNVALNLVWIPRFGIVGAALASSVSYTVVASVVVVAFLRITGSRAGDAFLLRREDWGRWSGFFSRMKEAVV